ncbi:DUF1697 domain-containing protein [uncultured Algibacter sp.]|uniref:DUF1697 domain-containing protein n=1 Tax=uncultured Algibacter sp. TaxID=298659 RepID=UPI002619389E|nr:DUF1697 domain-containing protein [uncultured Algibacter sp.]
MKTYIALLRGINVSGQKKIPMEELRVLLSKTGLNNVKTYIQSGNVIFQSKEGAIESLELKIHNEIKNHFGFEVPVIVKTPEKLKQNFDDCPFSEEKKEKSYFMMLFDVPEKAIVDEVFKISYPNEEFHITDNCVYFYCATGYGKAKMSNNFFERKLKVTATARNYKTMVKLLSLLTDN